MSRDDDDKPREDGLDRIPRQSFWQAMPRRSLSRVLILVAGLLGILYLQRQTGNIAGCMSQAFNAPAPARREARDVVHAQVQVPVPSRTDAAR